jgi:hypothetical protein
MTDQSHLDHKYFIDDSIYNCPFCNRRHVSYGIYDKVSFSWSNEKKCDAWFVRCKSCSKGSMHLTFSELQAPGLTSLRLNKLLELDAEIFYSVPTSYFTVDSRIPAEIRELISEAEGCVKMNYLTGASACTRKAIYELTIKEKAEGENYEDRIKFLKTKFTHIEPELFDVLSHIKDMTSDKVHEQSWDKWESGHLKLFLETLKVILHEIYVIPDERKKRSASISGMLPSVFADKAKRRQVGGNSGDE